MSEKGTKGLQRRPGEIQLPFDVHFSPDGYHKLAKLVVASIEREMEKGPARNDASSSPLPSGSSLKNTGNPP